MACEVKFSALISELASVRKFLFPNFIQSEVKNQSDELEWNDNWEWTDISDKNEPVEEGKYDAWLQECIISISPASDAIVFAHEDKVVFLTAKWDGHESSDIKIKFNIVWKEKLQLDNYEQITSALCLPLASQKRSSHGGPDWTGVVVGFSSGHMRIYTETGSLLISQLLHLQPVIKLKCQTYAPSRNPNQALLSDELMILYPSVVVTIDGFSLFQALRACRNQLARAAASGSDVIQPPPLAYKKWGLNGQEKIIDFDAVGTIVNNLFEQLQNVSLTDGFYAAPKLAPSASSLFLTVGINPYVSFFYATEGYTPPIMSEIALAVASNLKNALFNAASGLLGFASKTPTDEVKPIPKIEPAKKLPMRHCIPDHRRGDSVVISPSRNLAAVTDNYGRVVLLDITKGIAVRIWKGYRDAYCAWIESHEDTLKHDNEKPSHPPRTALFLVIYAPRRGLLEVWSVQQGPRVAAFNVGKFSRLLYCGYNMMGCSRSSNSRPSATCHCCFVEPNGAIKTLDIPFHLALSDKSSKRARDLHLLRKLKSAMRNFQADDSESSQFIANLFTDFKTAAIRQLSLNRLINSSKINAGVIEHVVTAIIAQFSSQDSEEIDLESKLLIQQCQRIKQLLDLYKSCSNLKGQETVEEPEVTSPENVCQRLNLSEKQYEEVNDVLSMHKTVLAQAKCQVKFSPDVISISKFLSCFDLSTGHLEKGISDGSRLPIGLLNTNDAHLDDLATLIFSQTTNDSSIISELMAALSICGILPQELKLLLFTYWLQSKDMWMDWKFLLNFKLILEFLSKIPAESHNNGWSSVGDKLKSSTNIPAAYTSCLAICAIDNSIATGGDGSDEGVLRDKLLKNLEDTLTLSSLLQLKLSSRTAQENPVFSNSISLDALLNKGRSAVSELVAQWMVHNELDTRTIWSVSHLRKPESEKQINPNQVDFLLSLFKQIQLRFPSSMDYDALLSNVCWENAVKWNKDPDECSRMAAFVDTLKFIASSLLRHGVAAMLWRMFISKHFAATVLLFDKVGKIPKERICRKTIGFGTIALEKFLKFCSEILNVLLEVNEPLGMETVPISGTDRLWSNFDQGPAPLTELALTEKVTNSAVVDRHYQLAIIMYMFVAFKMKRTKPLSFFSSETKNVFFKDLDRNVHVPADNPDLIPIKLEFLARVITEVVRTYLECCVPPATEDSGMPSPSTNEQLQANHWISQVYMLGELWNIDGDRLKRIYICELYSSGLDQQAERVVKALSDCENMSSQLIEILGMRLHHIIKESKNVTKKVAVLTPALSSWIMSLDESVLRCKNPPAEATYNLLVQIVNMTDESSLENRRCMALKQVFESIYKEIE